ASKSSPMRSRGTALSTIDRQSCSAEFTPNKDTNAYWSSAIPPCDFAFCTKRCQAKVLPIPHFPFKHSTSGSGLARKRPISRSTISIDKDFSWLQLPPERLLGRRLSQNSGTMRQSLTAAASTLSHI